MNSIIVYFSQSGNTEKLAQFIHTEIGGEIKKISDDVDFAQFDTVLIGTPNWAAGAADPTKDFLKKHDFAGKTVVPFCTHGMGGLQNVESDIVSLCPGANMKKAFAIKGDNVDTAGVDVVEWLNEIGLK